VQKPSRWQLTEPKRPAYDEHSLRAIEGTFREVCEELTKRQPFYGCDDDSLRTAIVQQLLKLVELGITDPIKLRTAVLSYFDGQASV
jgi:hypothetical protein